MIKITLAAGSSGNFAVSGEVYTASLVGRPSAKLKYADISLAADSPIVPASATIVALSPNSCLRLTMNDDLAKERGETNASCCLAGL